MIEAPSCPTCSTSDWRVIGARVYRKSEMPGLREYARNGYIVFFESWFPGRDEVRVDSVLCGQCGLVVNSPRPGPLELADKYRVLKGLPGFGASKDGSVERARALEMFRAMTSLSGTTVRSGRVLDYGGGDGSLMLPFKEAGFECHLVDMSMQPVPWIRKVGDTLADIRGMGTSYDWIIASHVVEHLDDPLGVVRELGSLLQPDGHLFVEVPFEIWGKAPLQDNPVTHVNFFTRSSLRYLLEAAGLEVVGLELSSSLHPTKRRFAAVKAVARPGKGRVQAVPPGPAEAEGFLSSNPFSLFLNLSKVPRVAIDAVIHRISKLLGLIW